MKIIIVVDANIIISALLGGKPSIILFDPRFNFVTTEFTIREVQKYLPRLSEKLNISQGELERLLQQLPFRIYKKAFYKSTIPEATNPIGNIDEKDIDILALALTLEVYLWSQDKDFETAGYTKILKTYNFIE